MEFPRSYRRASHNSFSHTRSFILQILFSQSKYLCDQISPKILFTILHQHLTDFKSENITGESILCNSEKILLSFTGNPQIAGCAPSSFAVAHQMSAYASKAQSQNKETKITINL
jgi:hypothetical protein